MSIAMMNREARWRVTYEHWVYSEKKGQWELKTDAKVVTERSAKGAVSEAGAEDCRIHEITNLGTTGR